jgi:excinuclease UvrABC helicase subunit UvrB
MTEDEMNKLASIITNMIFERQAELDEEFMAEWQTQILVQTEMPNKQDELKRLEEMLSKAIEDEEFELAATIHQKITKLKSK